MMPASVMQISPSSRRLLEKYYIWRAEEREREREREKKTKKDKGDERRRKGGKRRRSKG